jgi:Ca2+-binding EF-hand superfamily protein
LATLAQSSGTDAVAAGQAACEVVLLTASRPVLVRIHAVKNGQPIQAAWLEAAKVLFLAHDRNGDGQLSRDEAASLMTPASLLGPDPQPLADADFARLDKNKDGLLSWAEFARAAEAACPGGVQLQLLQTVSPVPQEGTDALFDLLDSNRDNVLDRDELSRARQTLLRLDRDDNEILTLGEVTGQDRPAPAESPGAMRSASESPSRPRRAAWAYLSSAPDAPASWSREMLRRYSSPGRSRLKSPRLRPEDLRLDPAAFALLDGDKDGQADPEELARFCRLPADIELTVHLDDNGMVRQWSVLGSKEQRAGSPLKVQRDAVSLDLAEGRVLVAFSRVPSPMQHDAGNLAERLEASDAIELWKQRARLQGARLLVEAEELPPGVWAMLDANADGQLTLRELSRAPALLDTLPQEQGKLSRASFPRTYRLTLGQGTAGNMAPDVPPATGTRQPGESPQARDKQRPGPAWFTAMDRNGDGDLSWREFLGTPEQFRQVDRDGDGLISAEEAWQYAAGRR